jgi:hypothetical protein
MLGLIAKLDQLSIQALQLTIDTPLCIWILRNLRIVK